MEELKENETVNELADTVISGLYEDKGFKIIDLADDLSFNDICDYIHELNKEDADLRVCYRYCGKILYPGIKTDAAWYLLMGVPRFKDEYVKREEAKKEFEDRIAHRRDYMLDSDLKNIEKVKKARNDSPDGKEIKDFNVISGLKYFVENKDLPQEQFVDGLIDRGCMFLMNDVYDNYMEPYSADKFRDGLISAGAYVLVIARDSEDTRKDLYRKLCTIDDDNSVYHFIRANGEKDYTKEKVEAKIKALKASKEENNIIKKSL